MLSKHADNKKCAPRLMFFSEKRLRKMPMIFDIENWFWKSKLGTFWHLRSLLTQFSKFIHFLWVCLFSVKNLSNFVYPAWKLDNSYFHTIQLCSQLPLRHFAIFNILKPCSEIQLRYIFFLLCSRYGIELEWFMWFSKCLLNSSKLVLKNCNMKFWRSKGNWTLQNIRKLCRI